MVDKLPVMPEIDHGTGPIQPVNARDLGQAYYKAAMHEQLPQLEYICSGERPLTVHELCALIGEYLGKKTRFVSFHMGFGVFLAKGAQGCDLREEGLCRKNAAPRRGPQLQP